MIRRIRKLLGLGPKDGPTTEFRLGETVLIKYALEDGEYTVVLIDRRSGEDEYVIRDAAGNYLGTYESMSLIAAKDFLDLDKIVVDKPVEKE